MGTKRVGKWKTERERGQRKREKREGWWVISEGEGEV